MIITEASKSHIEEIINLNMQLGYKTAKEYLLKQLNKPSTLVFIAIQDDKIIGMAGGIIFDYFHYPQRIARLDALVIDNKVRRNGLGEKLLKHFEKEALKRKCSLIELSSSLHRQGDGTYDFYKKNNYLNQTEYGVTYFRKKIQDQTDSVTEEPK